MTDKIEQLRIELHIAQDKLVREIEAQLIRNNAMLVKYIVAAHDNTGEIRAAVLEQALAWIESGKHATIEDTVKPITVV